MAERAAKPGNHNWMIAALATLVVAAFWFGMFSTIWRRVLVGDNDFVVFYCGGKLAFTKLLYDPAACFAIQEKLFGGSAAPLTYIRLPFHAAFMSALAWLPYEAAYGIYQALQLSAVGWAVWRLRRLRPDFLFFAAFCPGLLVGFANGQDTGFVFALSVAAWLELREGSDRRDLQGGLLLSLCAIKIHLFPLVAVVLLIHGRWRTLAGGALGGAALAAISFAANGNWPVRFLEALGNPAIHPVIGSTTSFFNIVNLLGGGTPLESLFAFAAASIFGWATWRMRQRMPHAFDVSYGLALALGLLIGHHAYLQDTVLMLAAVGILSAVKAPPLLVHITAIAAIPPVAMLLLVGRPFSLVYPAMLVALLISAAALAAKPALKQAPAPI